MQISACRWAAGCSVKRLAISSFTDWGLNGPGVMDLSYLISTYPGKDMVLELNLLHQFEAKIKALFKVH